MRTFFEFNSAQAEFPQTGNTIGTFEHGNGYLGVHLPNEYRTYSPLNILGSGKKVDDWLLWQMKQDIDRNEGLLCFDPKGKYGTDIVSIAGKENAKRIIWINFEDDERYFTLNPCNSLGQNIDSYFYEWREFLF